MRQQTSPAIVLRRTNYGEADRIVTFLTPIGKVKAIVKGVRRSKSKLAGGIELFSESTITFLQTQGDLQRIISTRLETHWDGIVGDLQRMMFGYEAMKLMDTIIEDEAERDYYELLRDTLAILGEAEVSLSGIKTWFYLRLLKLQGREPNLHTDQRGAKLIDDELYGFSAEEMCFYSSPNGTFRTEHIKLLRLLASHKSQVLRQVKDLSATAKPLETLIEQIAKL
ncbi:MAG: DNA repair protein RecO [Candidatus Saccharimonadales bacterium]